MSEHRTLLRSASLVTGITLLSRVFGYIRDLRIASLLGTSIAADAYTVAYMIPNLLRRLVGEGAVSAAFIPLFLKYITGNDRKNAWKFANTLITLITVAMTIVTLLGILFSPLIVRAIAIGFAETPGKLELTTLLNRIMFPYIFFISLSAMAMGILNSFNKFASPAFAPVAMNLSVIALSFFTGFFTSPEKALAVGVVIGGMAQLLVQIPQLLRTGWRFIPTFNLTDPGVLHVGRLMVPILAGVGVAQINFIVGRIFASFLGNGPQMALYLSDRVMELVLGGYAVAIATVVLPLLSRQAAAHQMDQMKETLNFAVRIILFLTIPATVGLIILRVPIIEVLFEHGEFGAESTALTTGPLLYFALGLSSLALVKIIVPAFYSLKDTRSPVWIAFWAMLLNVVFNFLLYGSLGVSGPALSMSLAALFNAIALITIFSKQHGSIGLSSILTSIVRFSISAIPLAILATYLINLPGFYFQQTFGRQVMTLGVTILASVVVYFLAAFSMRCRELSEIRDVFASPR